MSLPDTIHRVRIKPIETDGVIRWQVQCLECGRVSVPQEFEADAIAIMKRHREIRGFERA